MLDGLRGEHSIAELSRRVGIGTAQGPSLRHHGANAPSAGLTSYRLDDDNHLDRFEIEDGTWRKATWCRRWSTSGPRLPA